MISTLSQTKNNSTTEALWVLIQNQTKTVRNVLFKRLLAEQDAKVIQQERIRNSLVRAFDELHAGKVHHDARKLFTE